jgi:hypothetical protein
LTKQFTIQNDIATAILDSEKCRVLSYGVDALKEKCVCVAGNPYLPPFNVELKDPNDTSIYRARVAKSQLKNYFMKAVNFSIGQIFKKDVKVKNIADLSDELKEFLGDDVNIGFNDDVDKHGNSLNVFVKNVLRSALINPAAFVLVDSPEYDKTDESIVINGVAYPNNKETEKEFQLNPYFVHIKFTDVITCQTVFDSKLGVVIKEFSYVDNRRLNSNNTYDYDVVKWTADKIEKTGMINGKKLAPVEKDNKFGFIPLSILILGEKVTDYFGIPPLIDLAGLNIVHFQKQSEHNNMLGWVKQPTWHVAGIDKEWLKNNPMGCGSAIITNEQGKLANVGIDSSAETGSMDDLKHDEEYMESFTLSLLESGNVKTATATNAIVGSTTSTIKVWAQALKDFMDGLYYNLLKVKGIESDILIDLFINQEFSKPFDTETANFIQTAASAGRISKKTFLEIVKQWGMLPEGFDVDAELTLLDEEIPSISYIPSEGGDADAGNQ